MSVTNELNKVSYSASGLATYPVPFRFFKDEHLKVYVNDVLQTLVTHYSVSGANDPSGGSLTFTSPPVSGSVVILREVPLKQENTFNEGGEFSANTIERMFDQNTYIDQQISEKVNRALKIPLSSDLDPQMKGEIVPNAVIKINSTGDGFDVGRSLEAFEGDLTSAVNQAILDADTQLQEYLDDAVSAKDSAELAKSQAESLKDDVILLKSETQTIKDDTNTIKDETLVIKSATDQVYTDTVSVKDEAESYRSAIEAALIAIDPESADLVALNNYPKCRPSLILDFENCPDDYLDPRITLSRASTATRINSYGLIEEVPVDMHRYDHDPITGQRTALLIEESRTNLLTYSNDFANGAWAKTRSSIISNAAVAPDGSLTASKMVEDTATNSHFIHQAFTPTGNTTYTWSIYLKKESREFAQIIVGQFAQQVNPNTIILNLTDGTFTATDTTRTLVRSYQNGWYRVSTTVTTIASPSVIWAQVLMSSTSASVTYTGDGTSGIYIWGAQLEVGTYPTSTIHTEGTPVTRSADLASITGTNFSSWYRQDEGTFVVKASSFAPSNSLRIIYRLSDGTPSNYIDTRFDSSADTLRSNIWNGGNQQAVLNGGTFDSEDETLIALGYKNGNSALAANGSLIEEALTGSIPALNRLRLGAVPESGSQVLNGHISRLTYYPKRLTNSELQAVTK